MQTNKTIAGVVLAILLSVFGAGMVHLFLLRFESGDIYPAYSSLRSDPLGTRALYVSLENIKSIAVHRNYQPLKSLAFEPQTTLFYLGAAPDDFNRVPQETIEAFDRLAQAGGRLVITFLPVAQKRENKASENALKSSGSTDPDSNTPAGGNSRGKQTSDRNSPAASSRSKPDSSKENTDRRENDGGQARQASIRKHWGIETAFKDILPLEDDQHLAIEATANRKDLPPVISWHTNMHFVLDDDAWQILYRYEELPLIVERKFGRGSILLCADSYFMSNEALWAERHPRLLLWLMGGHANLIFDEAHFGIYKQPSVAQYIRRYRFHWFFAALAALALLFIWKSAAHFLPPSDDESLGEAEVVSEKDYSQGLIALLRRNIAGNQLMQVCAREWIQTFKKSKHLQGGAHTHIKALAADGSPRIKTTKDPVGEYQAISREISQAGRGSLKKY